MTLPSLAASCASMSRACADTLSGTIFGGGTGSGGSSQPTIRLTISSLLRVASWPDPTAAVDETDDEGPPPTPPPPPPPGRGNFLVPRRWNTLGRSFGSTFLFGLSSSVILRFTGVDILFSTPAAPNRTYFAGASSKTQHDFSPPNATNSHPKTAVAEGRTPELHFALPEANGTTRNEHRLGRYNPE
uniref:(northern house mosquito) hypothetical protein n=1 Tax=Culex pipiens TaxID=7175 RepID=A0A8D8MHK5_CULPI